MRRFLTPWRVVAYCLLTGLGSGAILGFVLGLHYLPTLPFAIVEGASLVGAPALLLGLLLAGAWWVALSVRHRFQ